MKKNKSNTTLNIFITYRSFFDDLKELTWFSHGSSLKMGILRTHMHADQNMLELFPDDVDITEEENGDDEQNHHSSRSLPSQLLNKVPVYYRMFHINKYPVLTTPRIFESKCIHNNIEVVILYRLI